MGMVLLVLMCPNGSSTAKLFSILTSVKLFRCSLFGMSIERHRRLSVGGCGVGTSRLEVVASSSVLSLDYTLGCL